LLSVMVVDKRIISCDRKKILEGSTFRSEGGKTAWPKISQPETVFSHSSHGTGIGSGGSAPTFSGLYSSGKNPQVSTTNGNEAICRVFIQFMRQLSRKLFTGNSGQRIGSTSAILKIHQKWRLTISCIFAFHPETFYFCYEPFPAEFPLQLALTNANLNPSKLNKI